MRKITWKTIEAYARKQDGRVSPAELARRFGPHRATISRHFKAKNIPLEIGRARKRVSARIVEGLALFFLGFNREQIKRLVGVKSETLAKHLLRLDPEYKNRLGVGAYRMFNERVLKKLVAIWKRKRLELEWVEYIGAKFNGHLPAEKRRMLKLLSAAVERLPAQELVKQLRRINGFQAEVEGCAVRVKSSRGEVRMVNHYRF